MEKGRGRLYPQTDGVYYFGFGLTATAANGVGIDDFEVYDNENPFPVEAKYVAYGGLWSTSVNHLNDDMRYIYPGQPITFINQSKYATDYQWDTFGNPATTNEENPEVTYSESGDYRPLLNATNAKYTDSFSDVVNVTVLGKRKLQTLFATVQISMTKPLYRKKMFPVPMTM